MPKLEDLGFTNFHRRDVIADPELVARIGIEVDKQTPNTDQELPDLSLGDDKIDTLSVSKLITGTISSQRITLGVTLTEGDVYIGGGTFDAAAWTCTGGFLLGIDDSDSDKEKFFIGDATTSLDWNVTTADTLTIVGSITATTGTIGGWVITADALKDAAGTVGMSSAVTGGDDIRFFAGHATPASAPFYVTEAGVLTASSGTIGGFTLSATTLTGGIIQTSASATTGIKMSSTNLIGYDAANNQTFDLNASTGNLTLQSITGGGLIDVKGEIKPTLIIIAGQTVVADEFVWIKSDGKVYLTDANDSEDTDQYLGVAVEGASADDDVQVQLTGFYDGFSGLTIGSAYYLQDGTIIAEELTQTQDQAYTSLGVEQAQTFTATGETLLKVSLYMKKNLSPTGTTTITLRATNVGTGKPTGGDLITIGTISDASLTGSYIWYDFETYYELGSLLYAIVVTTTSTGVGSNFPVLGKDGTAGYGGGKLWQGSAESWADSGADLTFKTWELLGTIDTSAGSNSKKIGLATSATDLLLLNS